MSLPIRIWLIIITLAYSLAFFTLSFYKLESLSSLLLYTLWLMCAVTENASSHRATLLNNKVTRFFSGISMEIYLCHMMFFRIVEKLHLEHSMNNDDWNYWATCLLVLVGAVAFSLLWKRVERMFASTTSCWSLWAKGQKAMTIGLCLHIAMLRQAICKVCSLWFTISHVQRYDNLLKENGFSWK